MTKGKMVLELLKYAKSAIRKFRPIRGFHCGHVTLNGGLWLVEIFWLQIWHIWAILRLFYPWSNFDPGIISIFFSPKTHFWGPFEQFYFWCFQGKVHNGFFWKENFQTSLGSKVTVSKFLFLKCSYLIGRGSDFYLQ